MTMWDRLCELLRAREVSVEDVSNKVSTYQWARIVQLPACYQDKSPEIQL